MNNASASLYLFACTCNRSQVVTTLHPPDTFLSLLVLLVKTGFTEAVPKPPPVCNPAKHLCTHQQDPEVVMCQIPYSLNQVRRELFAVLKQYSGAAVYGTHLCR